MKLKNRIKKILIAALIAIFAGGTVAALSIGTSIQEAEAASNPYPTTQDYDRDGYYEVPCTRFAWQQAYDNLGIALPAWGNAGNWFNNAKNAGYQTGTTPMPNSIAVWSGHVAYVTSVSGGNTFTVNEGGRTDKDNTSSHGIVYGYTLTNAAGAKRPYDSSNVLLGFIYLSSTPKPVTYSSIESSKSVYFLNDTVKINVATSGATGQTIGIDRGSQRVITQACSSTYSIPASQLGVGDYSAYFTIYNNYSVLDTRRVYFKIINLDNYDFNVGVSKSEYSLNDTVTIKVDSLGAAGQTIGIDRGNQRVITQGCPSTFTIPASQLGAGEYSAYFTVHNNGSSTRDTKRVYFKITVPVEKIDIAYCTLFGNDLTFDQGDSKNLGESITPSNATNKKVTWSSSDPSVVSVDATGTIKALKPGTATITVKTEDGGKTASCTVTVKATITEATSISLDKKLLVLDKGKSGKLKATVKPDNATNKTVTWSSSNTGVAKVDKNGNVTAVNHGTAKITAKTSNGKTAECEVRVNADTFTGVRKDAGQLKRFRSGAVDTAYTGVDKYTEDGKWYYFEKGIHNPGFTGIAKSSKGNWIFVRNGVYDTYFTGVAKSTKGNWIYVNSGRYDAGFTGVAKSTKGNWIFVRNGRYDAGFTGVAKSTKGNWIYVKNGRYDTSFTGIAQSTKGNKLYIVKGRWQNTYTGKYQNYNIKNGYVI